MPAPVDAVMAGEAREEDRERLPIGIAAIVPARIAAMTARRGSASACGFTLASGLAAVSLVFGTIEGRATFAGAESAGAAAGAAGAGAASSAFAARLEAVRRNAAATAVEKCFFICIIPINVALVGPAQFAAAVSEGKSLRARFRTSNIRLPLSAAGGSESVDRHFAAVLVSMLTTWTRRLIAVGRRRPRPSAWSCHSRR